MKGDPELSSDAQVMEIPRTSVRDDFRQTRSSAAGSAADFKVIAYRNDRGP